jgi:alkylhydroperoxidase family enzyme
MPGPGHGLKGAGAWQDRARPPSVLAYAPEVAGNYGSKKQENPREAPLARLPLIDPQNTTGDIRASFDRMTVKLNIFRMMAHAETNMIPAMRFANSILHKQKLSHVNRELLILQVAHIEGGEYEWRQHVPIALGVGVTQPQIDALGRGDYTASAFNEAERALLAFGREVTENVRVNDAIFAGMRKHFSDQEIVESIFTVGCYMMMARLTEATQTDLDPAAGMAVFDGGKKRSA